MILPLSDSVEPIVVAPNANQVKIRRLIAQDWDRPGQSIDTRRLVVMPIIDKIDRITHCIIAIDGTPWRGMALVSMLDDERAVRTSHTTMILSQRETRTLRQYLAGVTQQWRPADDIDGR